MVTPDLSQIILFLGATLLLNLTPGADVLYIASRSFSQGKKYGVVAAFGISSGIVIHVIITAFGVGEIFQYSPLAFWSLKLLGAVYLGYLGWKSFFSKEVVFQKADQMSKGSAFKTYLSGILTTILNPKVILFFLTFLPQFVDIVKGHVMFQLFFLGGLFILSGTLINLFYVFFLSLFKDLIFKSRKIALGFQKLTGILFGGLACKLLLAESR